MKRSVCACVAVFVTLASQLWAQSSPVVVELFTSQGCASCPPADRLMHKLAKRDDVIPLALHVDYWDYIGWKDEYARPGHTDRQRGYAHVAGRNMVYTPQMIINGQDDVVGARSMELADLISQHKSVPQTVDLDVILNGTKLTVRAKTVAAGRAKPMTIHLVRFTPHLSAQITRGENAGRHLDYANVVDGWSVLSEWDGEEQFLIETKLDGDRPAVILIQQSGPGAIVAAARVN